MTGKTMRIAWYLKTKVRKHFHCKTTRSILEKRLIQEKPSILNEESMEQRINQSVMKNHKGHASGERGDAPGETDDDPD